MMEADAGGGRDAEGRNEARKLKRKSDEPLLTEAKKSKRHWKSLPRRRKLGIWKKPKKQQKKPKSLDGDKPSSSSCKNRKRRLTGTFNAPFNSTQFLMNDHAPEAVRQLESNLEVIKKDTIEQNNENEDDVDYSILERPVRRITRARESSFSIDSDEDYYYSSPEDEEEFMNKEFIKDYDSCRNDRLVGMSKAELINEYLQMEQKIEALEKRLSNNDQEKTNTKETMAATIKEFQSEIQRLESENIKLKNKKNCSSCSSSCSSSDSEDSSSDSESSESSSSESEDEEIDEKKEILKNQNQNQVNDDTGYESGQSNKMKNTEVVKTKEEISDNCITSTSP